MEIFVNPQAVALAPAAGFPAPSREPLATHRTLPGYQPTPLVSCPALAERLGVATVVVKDESTRLGLPSFKILGASWAVLQAIKRAPAARGLVAATDGNHGRGVARMAKLLGLSCAILVPAGTAAARIDAIVSEGASVTVVDGTYDDAIVASAALADEHHLIISDTSWDGYESTPRAVIDGYSTLFYEIDDELAAQGLPQPTVVALQAGVGAFAAAALRHYRSSGTGSVHTVVVEPLTANCLMASARAGDMTEVPGPHASHMAGLNCGLPSQLAWPIVAAVTDTFIAIDDEFAYEAMRALAAVGIESGESGAAALGGLLALAEDPAAAAAAGLGPQSHVLFVNTEGATDPVNYAAVLGAEK
jgi:diaminopropionate ammonia-lyase